MWFYYASRVVVFERVGKYFKLQQIYIYATRRAVVLPSFSNTLAEIQDIGVLINNVFKSCKLQ